MTSLFANRYAPIENGIGYLRVPFDEAASALREWVAEFHPPWYVSAFGATLNEALERLQPLNHGFVLLAETHSEWTAVFSDDHWPLSPVSVMNRRLKCDGMLVMCVHDTYVEAENRGRLGGCQFYFMDTSRGDERSVSVINDCGSWHFEQHGEALDWEYLEAYRRRNVRDRLTPEMLQQYCDHLGIKIWVPEYYGQHFMKAWSPVLAGTSRTYAELQRELRMDGEGT